ncbi:MAG TPA: hypothetical protein VIL99_15860 [Ignavibacteria bacterium]
MDIQKLLEDNIYDIVEEAFHSMKCVKLKGYDKEGDERTKEKLRILYSVLSESVKEKSLLPMLNHVETIARERFSSGYDLYEVQTAINELEEAIWKRIFKEIKPDGLAEALGIVSIVLGAGKDTLARTYVSLATKSKASSLNLQALFKGSEGNR